MREERDLAEVRTPVALAHPGGDEAAAPAGVDEHLRPHGLGRTRAAHAHGHAVAIEVGRLDARGLKDGRARAAGVVEQQRVELGARHLVGVVGPRLPGQEVEAPVEAVLLVEERGAVLDLEAVSLDLAPHAHLLEQQHRGGHE